MPPWYSDFKHDTLMSNNTSFHVILYQLVLVRVLRIHGEADKLWGGLITAECSCKNRMPVLFDYTFTTYCIALRDRQNGGFWRISTLLFKYPALIERVVSLGIIFLTYTFNFYFSQQFPLRGY